MGSREPVIADGSLRELFHGWVEEARADIRPPPSQRAGAYLVDLLTERLRARGRRSAAAERTLAEAWLTARGAEGARRVERLRAVGDRALFVAGFFGESLTRRVVGIDYYRDIGQAAYGDLSSWLSSRGRDAFWGSLYSELAASFPGCIEVLARVGGRTRAPAGRDLLHLYDRWLATGDDSVRRELLRRGCLVGTRPERSLQ